MKELATTIVDTVNTFAEELLRMDEAEFSKKKVPGKWSRLEILGHLVDSAQNNVQRFVRAQYEPEPPEIIYQQDDWVRLGNYQHYSKNGLVHFWIAMNIHLCHVLFSMEAPNYGKPCMTGSGERKPLLFFAEDYLRHLRHHIEQIKQY